MSHESASDTQELNNAGSRILYERALKPSLEGRAGMFSGAQEYGSGFASFRGVPIGDGLVYSASTDGVGSKIEVAERMQYHRTLGHDLVAMAADDAAIRGGEPFAMTNIIDVNTLENIPDDFIEQMAEGLREAAETAGVPILDGELGLMGDRIRGYGDLNYTWGASIGWLVREDRIIDGSKLRPTDKLVALREHGLRSNGYAMARRGLSRPGAFGENWHEELVPDEEGAPRQLGELLLRPSVIYTPVMVALIGGSSKDRQPAAPVHGAAHITGGGIPEKLGRMLAGTGLGADITDPFEPPRVMSLIQNNAQFEWFVKVPSKDNKSDEPKMVRKTRPVTDWDAYKIWNMGQGMIIATPEPNAVIETAASYGIEAAEVGGLSDQPGIRIRSKALHINGDTPLVDDETLTYSAS